MRRRSRLRRELVLSVVGALLVVAASAGRVRAHGRASEPVAVHTWLAASAFLLGVAVGAVAVGDRDVVPSEHAETGVYAGGVLALAGLAVYVLV